MNVTMRVVKYLPKKLYGFLEDEQGSQYFFHLGAFSPTLNWLEVPPPILGERVTVEIQATARQADKPSPRVLKVVRSDKPKKVQGVLETFDSQRGYGFCKGLDGVSYHIHISELIEDRILLPGDKIVFFAGTRKERPRACHIKKI
jgi:cold shock CspA family protein